MPLFGGGAGLTQDRAGGRSNSGGLYVCWVSDIGKTRENNEDACIALPEQGLLIVADGMGGEHAGELASKLVVQWLPEIVVEQLGGALGTDLHSVESALRDAIIVLNHRLRVECSTLGDGNKMGATVAMVLVRGSAAHVAHMGDSRVYLLRDGRLQRLTKDQSVVGVLLERGAITPEQAEIHPMRTQLARYVGMGGEARPEVRTVNLRVGDRLMLCTDGLTDSLKDNAIQHILVRHSEIELACQALVKAAESRDNITIMIADWRGE